MNPPEAPLCTGLHLTGAAETLWPLRPWPCSEAKKVGVVNVEALKRA